MTLGLCDLNRSYQNGLSIASDGERATGVSAAGSLAAGAAGADVGSVHERPEGVGAHLVGDDVQGHRAQLLVVADGTAWNTRKRYYEIL